MALWSLLTYRVNIPMAKYSWTLTSQISRPSVAPDQCGGQPDQLNVLAPYIAEINLKPDNVFVCFLLAYLSIHVFESLRKSLGNLKWRFSDSEPISFGASASGNRRKRKEVDF